MFKSTLPSKEAPHLNDKTHVFNVSTGESWEGILAASIPLMPKDRRVVLLRKIAATACMEALLGRTMS